MYNFGVSNYFQIMFNLLLIKSFPLKLKFISLIKNQILIFYFTMLKEMLQKNNNSNCVINF